MPGIQLLPDTELIGELRMTLANESTSAQITFSCKARPLRSFRYARRHKE